MRFTAIPRKKTLRHFRARRIYQCARSAHLLPNRAQFQFPSGPGL